MRWPHRMPVKRLQYFASWSIVRDRVRYGPQAVKVVLAVLPGYKRAPEVHLGLFGVLLLVQSIWCCMPDVHDCTFNRLPCSEVCDYAMHPRPVSLLIDLIGDYACAHV